MLRALFFALAAITVIAQQVQFETTVPQDLPAVDSLLTGGNDEYRKVIKGDINRDPATFKIFIQNATSGQPLAYSHDIPLFFNEQEQIYNMIVEIPRGDAMKTVVNCSAPMQSVEVFMNSERTQPAFELVDHIHNIGEMPQTFDNYNETDSRSHFLGSGTPLSILEISDKTHQIGDIVPVKILGVLGVQDKFLGHDIADYKIIAIDTRSDIAASINTLEDVEMHFPDLLAATRAYFRFYKFPGQINEILFDGKYQDTEFAHALIAERHQAWLKLIEMPTMPTGLDTQSHYPTAAHQANDEEWRKIIDRA